MKTHVLVILIVLLVSSARAEPKQDFIWVRIVTSNQALSGVRYQYFVYYEEKGVPRAYPVDTDQKAIADALKKFTN